jgi:hypothetical protein
MSFIETVLEALAAAGLSSADSNGALRGWYLRQEAEDDNEDELDEDYRWLVLALCARQPSAIEDPDPARQQRILTMLRDAGAWNRNNERQYSEGVRNASLGRPQASMVPSFSKKNKPSL